MYVNLKHVYLPWINTQYLYSTDTHIHTHSYIYIYMYIICERSTWHWDATTHAVLTWSFVSVWITFPAPPSRHSLIKTFSALKSSSSDMLSAVVSTWDAAMFWQEEIKQMFRRIWASETRENPRWTSASLSELRGCARFGHTTAWPTHMKCMYMWQAHVLLAWGNDSCAGLSSWGGVLCARAASKPQVLENGKKLMSQQVCLTLSQNRQRAILATLSVCFVMLCFMSPSASVCHRWGFHLNVSQV